MGTEPGLVSALADILIECVDDGASVGFMAPLERPKAETFWADVLGRADRGERLILVAEAASRVLGTVQVILDLPENQPHRAEIAKLLVTPAARRRGVAEALMDRAEAEAVKAGRSLLVLDTASAEAERVDERRGWRRVGEIPGFARWPDGRPCSTTIFVKWLDRSA